jgi:Mrp family chromosome partitioning ATPase
VGEIAEALKRANAERTREEPESPAESDTQSPASAPVARELPPTPAPPPGSHRRAARQPAARAPQPGPHAEAARRAAEHAPASPLNVPAPARERNAPEPERLRQTEYCKDHLDLHRHLALRVRGELERRGIQAVSVVSALRNEGKTTVACNLAMALASLSPDRSVALIDLDLRNPSVARRLGIETQIGVEEVIHGTAGLDEIRLSIDQPSLDVFPAHDPQRAAHELLVEQRFADLMLELQHRYSILIVDTPPTLLVPDSTLILRHVGACLAVANIGVTRVRRFSEMLELLPDHQVIGKILNGTAPPKHQQDYYYAYSKESSD